MTRPPVQRTRSIADQQLQMSTLTTPVLGYDTGQTTPCRSPDVGTSWNFDPSDAGSVLVCQDNIEFMAGLPDGSMKLIVTSPPYNIGKLYEERGPLDSYVKGQARVIAECVRLLHPNGSLCWQVGNFVEHGEVVPLDTLLYPLFKEHGLKLRNRIVWHFEHGLHCTRRLSGRYETINWFTKKRQVHVQHRSDSCSGEIPWKASFQGSEYR